MPHHVVVAKATPKAGAAAELRSLLEAGATASWEEPGVVAYAVHDVKDEPGALLLVEVYASEDAFHAHLETDHVRHTLSVLPDLLESELFVVQGSPAGFADHPKAEVRS